VIPVKSITNKSRANPGFTLVELMVAIAIVAILAAMAVPKFTEYIADSRMAEATTNIQGILEAEQAYFTKFQMFTPQVANGVNYMVECPTMLPAKGENQVWPRGGCSAGWTELGWQPEGVIYFQYAVFANNTENGDIIPNFTIQPAGVQTNDWGVGPTGNDWTAETRNNTIQFCAVQARADTDGDGNQVYFRSNSITQKIYRSPNPNPDLVPPQLKTW
jgi:prepilin-type N-terminal cleavage/methylation domain-containing protein